MKPFSFLEDGTMTLLETVIGTKNASRVLAKCGAAKRTEALRHIAVALRENEEPILAANALDITAGKEAGLAPSFLDRLALSVSRIEDMARAVEEIAAQADPIGAVEKQWIRPNGLRVGKMRIPLGVIAVIYEARPNVTSDAAALAIRSGNGIVLKGGSAAARSNAAVGHAVGAGLEAAGLPAAAVTVLTTSSRDEIAELLTFEDQIDLVIPRGGEGLIRFVSERSRIPVVKHYKGVCHVYIDAHADLETAVRIVLNGKVSRPSVCNSVETVLVHSAVANEAVPALVEALAKEGVTVHGDLAVAALAPGVVPATDADWAAEYLSLDVAMAVVADLSGAISHIEAWGSDHTEAIITRDIAAAQRFKDEVMSSCVIVNASTRFADGGQLGLGAEIGISTSRVHAYGPMGVEGLTTTRFVIDGDGQIR
ncbi:MAG: glutamate-5-semialdehyde dehydrogenase [Bradymonadia bacterium]